MGVHRGALKFLRKVKDGKIRRQGGGKAPPALDLDFKRPG